MEKGEKLKVYFKMNDQYYGLFNIIQMGKYGDVDLKITDYYNNIILKTECSEVDKGYLTEEEMEASKFIKHAEMSYHKDGSFLHKEMDGSNTEHSNPYGQGMRWTSTNSIQDFQSVMFIAIRRMAIIKKYICIPELKSKEKAYICENDSLFETSGTYIVILYIRNKKLTVNCYTSIQLYSDIIAELNDNLDLCIFIQRHHYPKPQPYYSKKFKSIVTPYLCNSINFCNKDTVKDEMKDKFDNTIFDLTFHMFLLAMTDNKFINLSDDKLQLIDEIDILYRGHEGKMSASKPIFIKFILKILNNSISEFNKLTPLIKQNVLRQFNKMLQLILFI